MEEWNGIRENDKSAFWFGLMMDADPKVFMMLMQKAADKRWKATTDSKGE